MASGTLPPVSTPDEPALPRESAESRVYIDKRLRHTRRQVKNADVLAGLITLAAGTLAYLLLAVLLDHWIVPSGLGFAGRLVLFAGLLVGACLWLAVGVMPSVVHRINPLFAAQSIEQSRPSLRNSLLNLLYLRSRPDEVDHDELTRGIYQALEQKAATDLEKIPADVVVDRSRVIRLGYLLVAVLAVACLYLVMSPKSPLVSARRVVWPWADVKAPTRVTIDGVKPGDELVYQGDVIAVSAKVDGLADDEAVMLYYTTADGQSVDQAIPMTLSDGRYRYECDVPPGMSGLQQNVEYYLAAGDCRTPPFKLEVQTALSILVDRVEYDYPAYTGIPDRVDTRVADLKAIEGTRVTVWATANHDIDRALVEMGSDTRHARKLTLDSPRKANARFTLLTHPNDLGRPEHESYQLCFTDTGGRRSRRPVRHRIEVLRDLKPEISFLKPPPEEIELPENGILELQIRAEDPDFALRRVVLRAERDDQSLPIPPLLEKPRPEAPHEGPFEKTYRFEPARLGLKAGEKVIYWAEAEDNMYWDEDLGTRRLDSASAQGGRPRPNRSETARRWIIIGPPERGLTPGPGPHQVERPTSEKPEDEQDPSLQQPDPSQETPPDLELLQEEESQPEESESPEEMPGEQQQSGEEGEEQGESGQQGEDQGQPGQQQSDQQGEDPQQGAAGEGSQSQPPAEGSPREGPDGQTPGQEQDGTSGPASQQGSTQPSDSSDAGQNSEPKSGPPSGGSPSPRSEPIDETNPGDAFQEILEHLKEQGASQGESDDPADPEGQPSQSQSNDPSEGEVSDQAREDPDGQGGDPNESPGDGGAGKSSDEPTGTALQQEAHRERDKQQAAEGERSEPGEGESAQSPTTNPKDSDSQGETSGDRTGGGEEGGGQDSDQSGAGSAGSHTAAEQGASQSEGQGEGETGTEAGDQVMADQPTGSPADEGKGPGSSQRDLSGDQQSGEQPQDQQDGPPSSDDAASAQPGEKQARNADPNEKPESQGSGSQSTGGRPGEERNNPHPPEPGEYQGEDPNLEYAREATDLALEYLEDQLAKDEPDRQLLERLGWTRDDLKRLYDQWDGMRRKADQGGRTGVEAQEDLDKALRSLGLRARSTELSGDRTPADQMRNLKEGFRLSPPPEWADAFRAYTMGVAEDE